MDAGSYALTGFFYKKRVYFTQIFILGVFAIVLLGQPIIGANRGLSVLLSSCGYLLALIGVLGRVYCTLFISGRKSHVLIAAGPFAAVRNPLYCFSLLCFVGIGLQTYSLTLLLSLLVFFGTYYHFLVTKEEVRLKSVFGEQYKLYLQQVPRWLPKLNGVQSPQSVMTHPQIVFKTMRDSGLYFIAMILLGLINYLHQSHILKPLFYFI